MSSVSGFILKDASLVELIGAIRVVAIGGALLAPSAPRRIVALFGWQVGVGLGAVPGLERLTEREGEIAAWVATVRSNDEIAAALFLSPDTVRTHVSRAMVKLHALDHCPTRRLRAPGGSNRALSVVIPRAPHSRSRGRGNSCRGPGP